VSEEEKAGQGERKEDRGEWLDTKSKEGGFQTFSNWALSGQTSAGFRSARVGVGGGTDETHSEDRKVHYVFTREAKVSVKEGTPGAVTPRLTPEDAGIPSPAGKRTHEPKKENVRKIMHAPLLPGTLGRPQHHLNKYHKWV